MSKSQDTDQDTDHGSDVAFIRQLAELLRENDLTELEVSREYGENDELNVRLCRGGPAMAAQPAPAPASVATAPVAASPQAPAAAETAPAGDPDAHPGAVSSPMVGTIYLGPEPDAANFIAVGDQVAEGQTLLIIEAMKTMNQIPSPRAGVVRRILVANEQPVEFGAPLVIIE